mgnify:CR=1 FL=1
MKLSKRLELLKEIKRDILTNERTILKALKDDLNKCEFEGVATEVQYVLSEIDHAIRKLAKWVKPKKVSTPLLHWPAKSYIHFEPYGEILIIGPWNYPFQLIFSPLVGALSAGNKVVIKPSEVSPHTSEVINEILSQEKYRDIIKIVLGGVEQTTKLLERRFDYIFYTGSTAVGKIIMQAAAKNLTPVTLELGGKSPTVVTKFANLKIAARRILWGKLMNAGQTCIAPDYILIEESVKENFLREVKKEVAKLYGKDPSKSSDFGRIINSHHFDRLQKLIPEECIVGGDYDSETKYISPTIFESELESKIMKDEIFGPLLPIITFKDSEEAAEIIKDKEKPLAFYLFSENGSEVDYFKNEITSGGMCINDTLIHAANGKLPFGGVGHSGIGSYHGHFSFETFSHKKSIVHRANYLDIKLKYPPYFGKLKLVRWFLKFIG